MQRISRTVLIPLLTAVAGCAAPSDEAEDVDVATESALVDVLTTRSLEWENAVEAVNAEQLISLFANDPAAAIVGPAVSYRDYNSLAEYLAAVFATLESQVLDADDRRFAVLSPTAVAETLRGSIESTAVSGQVTRATFAVTRVWVLRDGQWKILHQNFATAPLDETAGS